MGKTEKSPAYQHYAAEWLGDPQLGQCGPATRGIWIDLLDNIFLLNVADGTIRGTTKSLGQLCRCTSYQMRVAIIELRETGTADVVESGGTYSITSRRMVRDWLKRKKYREDQARRRKGKKGGGVSQVSRRCLRRCLAIVSRLFVFLFFFSFG